MIGSVFIIKVVANYLAIRLRGKRASAESINQRDYILPFLPKTFDSAVNFKPRLTASPDR